MCIVIQKSKSDHPNARKYEIMDDGLRHSWHDSYGEAVAELDRLCEQAALVGEYESWRKYDTARIYYRELEDVA